jgi:hypothetical protein
MPRCRNSHAYTRLEVEAGTASCPLCWTRLPVTPEDGIGRAKWVTLPEHDEPPPPPAELRPACAVCGAGMRLSGSVPQRTRYTCDACPREVVRVRCACGAEEWVAPKEWPAGWRGGTCVACANPSEKPNR